MYFCHLIIEIYLNIGHFDFLANVRMLKFGSELRYGIRSPNVRTPVDIPNKHLHFDCFLKCYDNHNLSCQVVNTSLNNIYVRPNKIASCNSATFCLYNLDNSFVFFIRHNNNFQLFL